MKGRIGYCLVEVKTGSYSFDKVKCLAQCKALFGKANSHVAQFFGGGSLTAARVQGGAWWANVRGSFARFGSNVSAELHAGIPRTATPAGRYQKLAPEWAQVARGAAVAQTAARVADLAGWGKFRGSFAWFGAKMAAAAQLQNDVQLEILAFWKTAVSC